MNEGPPSRQKSKAEHFAEVEESIRDQAIKLAVHYSSVPPGDVEQVENLIKIAASDARDPDGTVVLNASGKKLSDLGGKNIAGLAIRIAEKAEEIVRSRITTAWALTILKECPPPAVAISGALIEVERILKSVNRITELDQTRFKTGPLSSLSDKQFESLKKGVTLYDPALAEVFDDDNEEFKLLQHWNKLHPALGAFSDNPLHDPTAGLALATTLLRGQKALTSAVPKQFIDALTDIEHARLAQFLGTSSKAKRKWYGRLQELSPERQALLSRFPAIRHLLSRMQQVQSPAKPPEKSDRIKKREVADEAIGKTLTRPEIEKILVEAWGTDEAGQKKLTEYRRFIGKFGGRFPFAASSADIAIEREVEKVLEVARRKRKAQRLVASPARPSVTPPPAPPAPQIPASEPARALPAPEPVSDPSDNPPYSEGGDDVSALLARLRSKTGKPRIDD